MQLITKKLGDVTIVSLPGEHLDASRTEEFKRDIAPVLEGVRFAVFDLSRLSFVDSAGIGALLSCLRRLNALEGDLKLFGLLPQVRGVFELTRMQRIFDIFDTEEEAIGAFSS